MYYYYYKSNVSCVDYECSLPRIFVSHRARSSFMGSRLASWRLVSHSWYCCMSVRPGPLGGLGLMKLHMVPFWQPEEGQEDRTHTDDADKGSFRHVYICTVEIINMDLCNRLPYSRCAINISYMKLIMFFFVVEIVIYSATFSGSASCVG